MERSGENAANNEKQIFDYISTLEHMDKSLFMVYTEISSWHCQKGGGFMPDRVYIACDLNTAENREMPMFFENP